MAYALPDQGWAGPSQPARDRARAGAPNAEDVMAGSRKKGTGGRGASKSSGQTGGSRRPGGQSASSRGRSAGSGDRSVGEGYKGPSTRPVSEGLEGSVLEGASGYGDAEGQRRSTGAGAEASEGIHGTSSRRGESSRSSAPKARNASRQTSSGGDQAKSRPSGSEPMRGSDRQHVSGYGGAGGAPKTSSDQREPTPREQPQGGSRKRGSRAQGRLGDEEAGDGV